MLECILRIFFYKVFILTLFPFSEQIQRMIDYSNILFLFEFQINLHIIVSLLLVLF